MRVPLTASMTTARAWVHRVAVSVPGSSLLAPAAGSALAWARAIFISLYPSNPSERQNRKIVASATLHSPARAEMDRYCASSAWRIR